MNTANQLEIAGEDSVIEPAVSRLASNPAAGDSRANDSRANDDRADDQASADESPVNYEEAALLEMEIDGTDYRIDVGRAGTALCISTRPSGSWGWVFRGEAKWQVSQLRCKALDREVLTRLSRALAEAAADSQS